MFQTIGCEFFGQFIGDGAGRVPCSLTPGVPHPLTQLFALDSHLFQALRLSAPLLAPAGNRLAGAGSFVSQRAEQRGRAGEDGDGEGKGRDLKLIFGKRGAQVAGG